MDDLRGGGRGVRLAAFGAAVVTVAAGLGSRGVLPAEAGKVAGDVLYTVLVYAVAVLVAPRTGPARAGAVALGVSWAVEFFQATGIPAGLARHSLLARLVLGTTFNVPDLLWYVVGAAGAVIMHIISVRLTINGRPG
ncbi:DUF2809 domain-containing protein [Kitasatospora sp. NPDC006697]|uniref:ribosomal maturation YjgA family protein n=1 Tax=Kitasatospora sp. NPDC006697 TaxID=3364020 RepID=UPI0036BAB8F5